MPNILALDTATDACSVAVSCGGEIRSRYELIPRQHNLRLFSMLREVLPAGNLRQQGIDLLAYNHGPGSFTGLRIAASAMQGLAYSNDLPVAGVSTLACMAQGAWRRGEIDESATVLVMLDARINEIYWGLYELVDGCALSLRPDSVCAPALLPDDLGREEKPIAVVGNGLCYQDDVAEKLRARWCNTLPAVWPDSIDLLPLATAARSAGLVLKSEQVAPVYLRDEISWKKLAEQGKQRIE